MKSSQNNLMQQGGLCGWTSCCPLLFT